MRPDVPRQNRVGISPAAVEPLVDERCAVGVAAVVAADEDVAHGLGGFIGAFERVHPYVGVVVPRALAVNLVP